MGLIDSLQELILSSKDHINRLGISEWKSILKDLNDADIVSLFKGMVIAEKQLNWSVGSVAGGIWIYKEIQKRKLDDHYQIANWALKNTNNEYVPFGTVNHGKKNAVDYFLMRQRYSHQKEIENRNREINLLQRKIVGLEKQLKQKEDYIAEIKERHELSKLSGNELIQFIIEDKEKPIYYYTKELERLVDDDKTNDHYLRQIFARFKEKEKGNINRLKRKIEARFRNDKG